VVLKYKKNEKIETKLENVTLGCKSNIVYSKLIFSSTLQISIGKFFMDSIIHSKPFITITIGKMKEKLPYYDNFNIRRRYILFS